MIPSQEDQNLRASLRTLRLALTLIGLLVICTCLSTVANGVIHANDQVNPQPTNTKALAPHLVNTGAHAARRNLNEQNETVHDKTSKPTSKPSATARAPRASSPPAYCIPIVAHASKQQIFFQYLILALSAIAIMLANLKDWPATRAWVCEVQPSIDMIQDSAAELRRAYSMQNIGATFAMTGGVLLALNLASSPGWILPDWQIRLLDGAGYTAIVFGVVYIVVGLDPRGWRAARDLPF